MSLAQIGTALFAGYGVYYVSSSFWPEPEKDMTLKYAGMAAGLYIFYTGMSVPVVTPLLSKVLPSGPTATE